MATYTLDVQTHNAPTAITDTGGNKPPSVITPSAQRSSLPSLRLVSTAWRSWSSPGERTRPCKFAFFYSGAYPRRTTRGFLVGSES